MTDGVAVSRVPLDRLLFVAKVKKSVLLVGPASPQVLT